MAATNYFTKANRNDYTDEQLALLNQKLDNALTNLPGHLWFPGVEDTLAEHIERKHLGIMVKYLFFDRDNKLIDRTVMASTDKVARQRAKRQGIKFFGYCQEANYPTILQWEMEMAEREMGWDPAP